MSSNASLAVGATPKISISGASALSRSQSTSDMKALSSTIKAVVSNIISIAKIQTSFIPLDKSNDHLIIIALI